MLHKIYRLKDRVRDDLPYLYFSVPLVVLFPYIGV